MPAVSLFANVRIAVGVGFNNWQSKFDPGFIVVLLWCLCVPGLCMLQVSFVGFGGIISSSKDAASNLSFRGDACSCSS